MTKETKHSLRDPLLNTEVPPMCQYFSVVAWNFKHIKDLEQCPTCVKEHTPQVAVD